MGSIFITLLDAQNVTASTNPTYSMDMTGGTNQTESVVNNTDTTNTTLTKKLNVVTSVSPITNIVENVGGEKITLAGLVPEGVNSHTFELVPSDVVKVNDADLVIIDGLGLEVNIEDVVDAAQNVNPDLQILKLGDNTITPDQYVFDFSFPKEAGDPNPHLWLNVLYAMKFANLTRDKLIEIDPANADYYAENTNRYITKLKQLDEGIMRAVQTVPSENRKLLTYHDSWAYFAPRYGMVVIGAIQPSDFGQPTPQEVSSLIDQIKTEKVPAIFGSKVFPTEVVDQIANEADVQIVSTLSDDDLPGDPGDPQNSYVGMMLENMENMVVPLGGNVSALSNLDPTDTYASD
ncbi:MAG TPA: metal ABC transporter substrate-binding protein [Nitrososphaeraceae archaeon]|nr:metal ABC transporter substrate-binding protein [Nitrososphaeraceae archaeon]